MAPGPVGAAQVATYCVLGPGHAAVPGALGGDWAQWAGAVSAVKSDDDDNDGDGMQSGNFRCQLLPAGPPPSGTSWAPVVTTALSSQWDFTPPGLVAPVTRISGVGICPAHSGTKAPCSHAGCGQQGAVSLGSGHNVHVS